MGWHWQGASCAPSEAGAEERAPGMIEEDKMKLVDHLMGLNILKWYLYFW